MPGIWRYNDGMKEALRQAVASASFISYFYKQPSLGRVAVVAFYSNCDGDSKHMKRYCNWHASHLLSRYGIGRNVEANRLRYSSALFTLSSTQILAHLKIFGQTKNIQINE